MKKKKIEFHPNPQELWDEFHGVVAPVISVDGFEYERKYDDEPSYCKHIDEESDNIQKD